ncbi:antibiotic biosynthesis monooxygenase family protein [uncultured Nitratireductor sp.]|uniref:putative quinol monooxygenase n=1 Tax=uncultured Nitratireductor sp. TaxID=520953 RepID=UPI0025DC5988|nr:antibiotic biosynthesis monooxygenase family protein [uncultured Nitratireductor sp.]
MIVIAGHMAVPPEERRAHVAAHADMIRRARNHPGCVDFAICEDALDPARVNLFELWENDAALDAWRRVANPPASDAPLSAVTVRKHHVSHSGPPF